MAIQIGFEEYPSQNGWYCIAFIGDETKGDQVYGPILELENGSWFDEDGNEVISVVDPVIGHPCSIQSADYFIPQ